MQYHDFDNQDSLIFTDKCMALLQQELQNPYWNLHDPIMTKSYQISKDMDTEMMPHAMYFTGDLDTITKINHVPYQMIEYNDNDMFTAKLMNDTPIELLKLNLELVIYVYNGSVSPITDKYLSIREASHQIHSSNKFTVNRCKCKGKCNNGQCFCIRSSISCTNHCHPNFRM